jgi:DNA-binding transcriptional ArsR family regulator
MIGVHVAILSAISEPRRRDILRLVWTQEQAAGAIHRAIGEVTFGAVSQHLRVLADAGLVDVRKDGRHRYYRARRAALGPLRRWLEQMWAAALTDLARLAEADETAETTDAPAVLARPNDRNPRAPRHRVPVLHRSRAVRAVVG